MTDDADYILLVVLSTCLAGVVYSSQNSIFCVQDIQECGEPQGDGDHAVQPHLQRQPEESPPAAEPRPVT